MNYSNLLKKVNTLVIEKEGSLPNTPEDGESGAFDMEDARSMEEHMALRELAANNGMPKEDIDLLFPMSDVGRVC